MNLLYTLTGYPPSVGGAQAYVHQLAQQMAQRHRVQVAAHWAETRTDWLLGTTLTAPGSGQYEIDAVPVHILSLNRGERLRLAPWVLAYYACQGPAIARIADRIAGHLARLAGGVSLIHNGRMGREGLSFASFRLARQLDVPLVLTPFHHPRWAGWRHRHYHQLYRQADRVIALTQVEKEALANLGVVPDRITVTGMGPILANSADGEAFRQRYGLEGPIVLFVGQKYAYKGCAALLDAASLAWARFPETRFVFLGPRTRHSRALFGRRHDRRVVELGAVDLATKTDALAACTLLCLPSTQESFGAVVTEAWMLGKPVVGGPGPALREVIDEGVDGLLAPQEAGGLAERILYLLERPALRDEMGRQGKAKTLAHFTWERLAAKTEQIYAAC